MATTNHEHPQPVFGVGDTVALRRRSDAVGTVTAVRGLTSLCRATSAWATPWHGRLPPARIASPPPRIRSATTTSDADPLRRRVATVTGYAPVSKSVRWRSDPDSASRPDELPRTVRTLRYRQVEGVR